jgi:hypothetical protein
MWADREFDMGINFGDIFRRLNKVNPRFYQNYYRGEDRKRYYSHHKQGKIPILKGERYIIEYNMACEDRNIIGTRQQLITERLTGILTTQLTREWEMLNGTGNNTHPWLNRPINRAEATLINELIKAIERTNTTDMEAVMEKATGIPKEIWSPTNNVHIPSRYWSYVGKERIQVSGRKREDGTIKKGKKKDKPGPRTSCSVFVSGTCGMRVPKCMLILCVMTPSLSLPCSAKRRRVEVRKQG